MSITAQLSPSFTPLTSSASPSGRSGTLMAARYSEHWHETGLNELFSVLFCFFFSGVRYYWWRIDWQQAHTHGGSAYDIPGDGKVAAARAALLRCSQLRGVWMRVSLHQGVGACLQGVGGGVGRQGGFYMVEKDTSEQQEIPLVLWNFFFSSSASRNRFDYREFGRFYKEKLYKCRSYVNVFLMLSNRVKVNVSLHTVVLGGSWHSLKMFTRAMDWTNWTEWDHTSWWCSRKLTDDLNGHSKSLVAWFLIDLCRLT